MMLTFTVSDPILDEEAGGHGFNTRLDPGEKTALIMARASQPAYDLFKELMLEGLGKRLDALREAAQQALAGDSRELSTEVEA